MLGQNWDERKEEILAKSLEKVLSFKVGDLIAFTKEDDTGCGPGTGDAVQIELTGKILSIKDQYAQVEHKWGICSVWLAIADKLEVSHI